jgi:MFS family permease
MHVEPPLAQQALAHSRWWLALTILLGQVTLAFSMFAVVVALPKIMSAMSADVTSIHWGMTGFQIARTVPMPALGWLSSLVGNRTLYLVGLVTTVVSTICCGLAWNLEALIFFRVIQGIGAAPAQVTGMVILYEIFPSRQRGLVLGLLLLAGSMGPTIGPTLGGYLVEEYSWRAMFYLSLPTAVFSLSLAPITLPKTSPLPTSRAGCLRADNHGHLDRCAVTSHYPGPETRLGLDVYSQPVRHRCRVFCGVHHHRAHGRVSLSRPWIVS